MVGPRRRSAAIGCWRGPDLHTTGATGVQTACWSLCPGAGLVAVCQTFVLFVLAKARLTAEARERLERRCEALRLKLRLVKAGLPADEVLRLQEEAREQRGRAGEGRGGLAAGRWRHWAR